MRSKGKRSRALGLFQVATVLALAVSLAGCGPAGTGLQRDAARQLQERVLGVSQAAATNDHAAALRALEGLEADLASAANSGHVSEERRRGIMAMVTAVRADLKAAVEAAETAAAAEAAAAEKVKADAEAAAAAEKAKADAEAAAKAAQVRAAPAPVPEQVPAPGQGKSNEGKSGGGKGKGKNG
ncbi:hypothetical protein FCN77_20550 [Arthrobacter sp. 24S4-2]|nr:hypothetical protein FCN77_20550 [Arthrobacter sp. 24S4-2]